MNRQYFPIVECRPESEPRKEIGRTRDFCGEKRLISHGRILADSLLAAAWALECPEVKGVKCRLARHRLMSVLTAPAVGRSERTGITKGYRFVVLMAASIAGIRA